MSDATRTRSSYDVRSTHEASVAAWGTYTGASVAPAVRAATSLQAYAQTHLSLSERVAIARQRNATAPRTWL